MNKKVSIKNDFFLAILIILLGIYIVFFSSYNSFIILGFKI
ncbi:MAG: hypothetical protein PHU94_03300 [Bacilli bacterium]|nr:hypothetical protein [Bacilli bacterium]MDD4733732.1 hypothetical protein [Bacilli bacterium]